MEKSFIIATNNRHKAEEMKRILEPLGISVVTAKEACVQMDVEETGTTFEENAELKADAVCRAAGLPAVADDSGLVVDALGGRPGVYSARYAGENATDSDRIDRLLAEMAEVASPDRTARFVCAVCCVFPSGRKISVRGSCEGLIAPGPEGSGGFGYDPVFIEKQTGKTFACLTDEEKDRLSHRGRALRQFADKLALAIQDERSV